MPTTRSLLRPKPRRLEEQVRELERLLGRKTMEVDILKEALDLARAKKPILLSHSPAPGNTREDHQHDARGRPLQPDGTPGSEAAFAWAGGARRRS